MSEVVPYGTGQTRVSSSLWGRRTREAVLLLASVLVGLGASWGITELHRTALAEEQQVSRFSYVESLAIRILGFETVASHGPPASEAQDEWLDERGSIAAAANAELRDLLVDLRTNDAGHDIKAIELALAAYIASTGRLGRLVAGGDTIAAAAFDKDQVDPAFDRPIALIDAEAAVHQAGARQAQRRANTGIVGVLMGAAFLISTLSVIGSRARRREATAGGQRQALAESEDRFRQLVQHASDVTAVVDRDGRCLYVSPSVQRVMGFAPDVVMGKSLFVSLVPEEQRRLRDYLGAHFAAGSTVNGALVHEEITYVHPDGQSRVVEVVGTMPPKSGKLVGLILNMRDITERKALERELEHQAFHDSLTGLPNRALFRERLDLALRWGRGAGTRVGVLFLDLDNFKLVNDSLGHKAGDKLLIAVANHLAGCVSAGDTIARLGGDEFTILVEGMTDATQVALVAERISECLATPFSIESREFLVRASIGVAVSSPDMRSAEELLRDADVAMYEAKAKGHGRHVIYEPVMTERTWERMELEGELRQALRDDQFIVLYQPVIDLVTGRVEEVEALVRWQHPTRGLVSPCTFIPLAEETGLIVDLGAWVLETSCLQADQWNRSFDHPIGICVNVSGRQFQDPGFVDTVTRILRDTGFDAYRLKLEITESVMMDDIRETSRTFEALVNMGVRIAIDDFGTGYSSMAYLERFPIDTLKIDRSFIQRLGTDDGDMVQAVVVFAKMLGLRVTAEGIETERQCELLRRMGCEMGQGYLFARPGAADAVLAMVNGEATPGLRRPFASGAAIGILPRAPIRPARAPRVSA
ncbi:MAG: EAL domain-containing protein [Chloroflexota bacterium]|nr:EAL domain-containing protein [Chloroflexota bacterium]